MASAQFETAFENIVFSFTATNCNLNQVFHWGDEWAMLPFHHDLFKVNIKVVDTDTKWFYHDLSKNLCPLNRLKILFKQRPIAVNYGKI